MEYIRTFTKDFQYIGIKEREDVHRDGDWHEVFHCWVLEKRETDWWIYLQQRSLQKKDYPGDLDITAAGHLHCTERVEDGVRELGEELGLLVKFDDLMSLGIIPYHIQTEKINDAEFAHVFLHFHSGSMEDMIIQKEELDGLYATPLQDFLTLIRQEVSEIEIEGYQLEKGEKRFEARWIRLGDLGALPSEYLTELATRMKRTQF